MLDSDFPPSRTAVRKYRRRRYSELAVIQHEIKRLQLLEEETKRRTSVEHLAYLFGVGTDVIQSILNNRSN